VGWRVRRGRLVGLRVTPIAIRPAQRWSDDLDLIRHRRAASTRLTLLGFILRFLHVNGSLSNGRPHHWSRTKIGSLRLHVHANHLLGLVEQNVAVTLGPVRFQRIRRCTSVTRTKTRRKPPGLTTRSRRLAINRSTDLREMPPSITRAASRSSRGDVFSSFV